MRLDCPYRRVHAFEWFLDFDRLVVAVFINLSAGDVCRRMIDAQQKLFHLVDQVKGLCPLPPVFWAVTVVFPLS